MLGRRPRTAKEGQEALRSRVTFAGSVPLTTLESLWRPTSGQARSTSTRAAAAAARRHVWAPHGALWATKSAALSSLSSVAASSSGVWPMPSSSGGGEAGARGAPASTSRMASSFATPLSQEQAASFRESHRREQKHFQERLTHAKREGKWDEGLKQAARGIYSGNAVDTQFHFGVKDRFRQWETVGCVPSLLCQQATAPAAAHRTSCSTPRHYASHSATCRRRNKDDSGCGFRTRVSETGSLHSYAPQKFECDRFSTVKWRTKEDQSTGLSDVMQIPYKVHRGRQLPPPRVAVLDPYDARDGCMHLTVCVPTTRPTTANSRPQRNGHSNKQNWATESMNMRSFTPRERAWATAWA
jgi:hypothetical protein